MKAFGLTIEPSPKAACKRLEEGDANGDQPTVACSREGRSKTIQLDEAYKAAWRTNSKQLHGILLQTGWEEGSYNSEESYKVVGQGESTHYERVKIEELHRRRH